MSATTTPDPEAVAAARVSTRPNGPPHPSTTHKPRAAILSGQEVVMIPLSGKHGIGNAAIINAADWAWIEPRFGAKWILNVTPRDPKGRVVSGRVAIAAAARQDGKVPLVSLARIIADAQPGDRVFVKNGDTLDLRFENLEALSNDTIAAFMANLHAPEREDLIEVG